MSLPLLVQIWTSTTVGEIDEELVDDEADLEWKEIGLLLIKSVMDEVVETTSPPGLRLVKKTEINDD